MQNPTLAVCIISLVNIITKKWTIRSDEFIVPAQVNDHLITVSVLNNYRLRLTFPPELKRDPCEISFDMSKTKEPSPRPYTKELGNGKIIVSAQIYERIEEDHSGSLYVVVDPLKCTGKAIELPGKDLDMFHQVVPVAFRDTFDLFPFSYISSNYTRLLKIKRYNDEAEPMKVPHSIDPRLKLTGVADHVYPLDAEDPSQGYFIIFNNRTAATLTLLSSEFQITKQVYREGARVFSGSTSYGKVTICYKKDNHLICEFLDKDLNSGIAVPMMRPPKGRLFDATVLNLPDNSAMVTIRYLAVSEDVRQVLYLQRVYEAGSTSDPLELGKNFGFAFRSGGFIFEDKEYCATVVSGSEKDEPFMFYDNSYSSTLSVVCLDITK